MRKPKKFPRLRALKRKAPKVPDLTCPIIDDAISIIDNGYDLETKTFLLKKKHVADFKKRMEEIRSANDTLRDSGRYWYEKTKDLIEPESDIDYENY